MGGVRKHGSLLLGRPVAQNMHHVVRSFGTRALGPGIILLGRIKFGKMGIRAWDKSIMAWDKCNRAWDKCIRAWDKCIRVRSKAGSN